MNSWRTLHERIRKEIQLTTAILDEASDDGDNDGVSDALTKN